MDPVWTWSMLGFGILAAQTALFLVLLPRLLRAIPRFSRAQTAVSADPAPPNTTRNTARTNTPIAALLFALMFGLLSGAALGCTIRALAHQPAQRTPNENQGHNQDQSQHQGQDQSQAPSPPAQSERKATPHTPPGALPDADRFAELIAQELDALRASGVSEIAIEEHKRARMQDADWLEEARERHEREDAQSHADAGAPQNPAPAHTQAAPEVAPETTGRFTTQRPQTPAARTALLLASGAMLLTLGAITTWRPQSAAARSAPALYTTVLTATAIALAIIHT